MLKLPRNWRRMFGGAATRRILRQIPTLELRVVFQRHLLASALDSFASACFIKSGRRLLIQPRHGMCWQINDCTFKLFPVIDDNALYSFQQIAVRGQWYTIIVPPDHDWLFKHALKGLVGDKCPTVFSIDTYISW